MCLWNTDAPGGNIKSKSGKISKSYILTPPDPRGHGMSVKCEKPIDELTVQVWLLYHHPNIKYCTLFESGTELRTDGQTDGRTDRRTIRLLDAPGGPFRPGASKLIWCMIRNMLINVRLYRHLNYNVYRINTIFRPFLAPIYVTYMYIFTIIWIWDPRG